MSVNNNFKNTKNEWQFDPAVYGNRNEVLKRIKEATNSLDLYHLELNSIPPEIGKLTGLTKLNLSKNEITFLPTEIGLLTALVELELSMNKLTSIPSEIRHLRKLSKINLSSNALTHLPSEIGVLNNLTVLLFPKNKIKELPLGMKFLTNLTELSAWENEIKSLPTEIGLLNNLHLLLDFSKNKITSLPTEIGRLTKLAVLQFFMNELTSLPSDIGKLTSLTKLDLSSNRLPFLPPEIGRLTKLYSLNLFSNHLTSLPPHIGNLKNLSEFYLQENRLTCLPAEIGELAKLTILALNVNQVSVLPTTIGCLSNVKKLDLDDNKLIYLPSQIGQMTSLIELYLAKNKLLYLPFEMKQLFNLTKLHLHINNLSTVPYEIFSLPKLVDIDCRENPNLIEIPKSTVTIHTVSHTSPIIDLSAGELRAKIDAILGKYEPSAIFSSEFFEAKERALDKVNRCCNKILKCVGYFDLQMNFFQYRSICSPYVSFEENEALLEDIDLFKKRYKKIVIDGTGALSEMFPYEFSKIWNIYFNYLDLEGEIVKEEQQLIKETLQKRIDKTVQQLNEKYQTSFRFDSTIKDFKSDYVSLKEKVLKIVYGRFGSENPSIVVEQFSSQRKRETIQDKEIVLNETEQYCNTYKYQKMTLIARRHSGLTKDGRKILAQDIESLRELFITHVINRCALINDLFPEAFAKYWQNNPHIKYSIENDFGEGQIVPNESDLFKESPGAGRMGLNKETVKRIEAVLKNRVVGQEEAGKKISEVLRMIAAGFSDPKKPKAHMLFVGPTGVGKTEIVKVLAEQMKPFGYDFIRIDLHQYQSHAEGTQLFGTKRGYYDSEKEGELTVAFKNNPKQIVLFDETEKAHPEVLNTLLTLVDEGYFLEPKNLEKIECREGLFFFTTNAGSQEIPSIADQYTMSDESIMRSLRKHFKPEFIGRLGIVKFQPLNTDRLNEIIENNLKELTNEFLQNYLVLKYDHDVVQFFAQQAKEGGIRKVKDNLNKAVRSMVTDWVFENESRGEEEMVLELVVSNDKLDIKGTYH